jgi:hypothetical protein
MIYSPLSKLETISFSNCRGGLLDLHQFAESQREPSLAAKHTLHRYRLAALHFRKIHGVIFTEPTGDAMLPGPIFFRQQQRTLIFTGF